MKQGSREAGRARGQVGLELSPDHGMEDGNDLPGLHDERYLILDGADCDRIRFRERVPADGQQSGDGPGGRNLSQALRFSLFRPSAAHSVTTRSDPRNPCRLRRRNSSAPLRRPAAH
jgi:hypothetical protein